MTGDGDALSIGGNHLIHALRRNVNVKILLFNNQIYGLTKGQYSPTSELGKVTKSTPMGSIDYPFNPVSLAIGAEATFVARSIDTDRKHLTSVLRRAAAHKGTAIVEIYQNCNIFNDGAFDAVKEHPENQIRLEHGQPIRFGEDGERGVRQRADGSCELVDVAEVGEDALLVHDEHHETSSPRLRALPDRAHADGPDPVRRLPRHRAAGLRRADGRADRGGEGEARRGRSPRAPPGRRDLGDRLARRRNADRACGDYSP